MNREDLFDAIGYADEMMLEKSERKQTKAKRLFVGAIAACVALAIGIGAVFHSGENPLAPVFVGTQRLISSDQITWSVNNNVIIRSEKSISGAMISYYGPSYQFAWAISVEAKVIEVLPDVYSIPGLSTGSQKYRILRLKVLDEIIGVGIPNEIYYQLPETLEPDLTQYDSLILNMEQKGIEHYQMVNETTRQIEAFTFMFGQATYAPDYGAIMAFTDGEMDMSLWEKEGWERPKWYLGVASTTTDGYPGGVGRNIQDTKRAIIKQADRFKVDGEYSFCHKLITKAQLDWEGAEKLLDYVEPFKNGTFKSTLYSTNQGGREYVSVNYTRIINGFGTNETAWVSWEQRQIYRETRTNEPKVHFTQQDLENLPDLVSVMDDMDAYIPEKYQAESFEDHFCGVTGAYYKVGDTIYGVVSIEWGDSDYSPPKGPSCLLVMRVWEKTHILVLQDGTTRVVTNEELKSILET